MRIIRERFMADCARFALCALMMSGAAGAATAQDVPADLIGIWMVETISDETVDPGIEASLEFEGSGTVDGSGGCNALFGPYSNDDGFRIGPLCGNPEGVSAECSHPGAGLPQGNRGRPRFPPGIG